MKADDLIRYKKTQKVSWKEILENCLLLGDIYATPTELVQLKIDSNSWVKALENFSDEEKAEILTEIEKGNYTADYEVNDGIEEAHIYVNDYMIEVI
jgi:hypothetical protein